MLTREYISYRKINTSKSPGNLQHTFNLKSKALVYLIFEFPKLQIKQYEIVTR